MPDLLARRTRRANGVKWKLKKSQWVDPYPWVQKTGAEALVFAALMQRGIEFKFQVLITDIFPVFRGFPVLAMHPYRADFALPGVNIILDPWDDYHHSLPDQAQADAVKLAVYQSVGWKTYHVWSSDLMAHGPEWWFSQIPEMHSTRLKYGDVQILDTHDDQAGIVAANKARTKHPSYTLRRRALRGRQRLT